MKEFVLLIADFSKKFPKVYNTDEELKADNLLPENSVATIKNLNFQSFVTDLLKIYSTRFGRERFEVISVNKKFVNFRLGVR